jgi:transcription elongation factor Elf1
VLRRLEEVLSRRSQAFHAALYGTVFACRSANSKRTNAQRIDEMFTCPSCGKRPQSIFLIGVQRMFSCQHCNQRLMKRDGIALVVSITLGVVLAPLLFWVHWFVGIVGTIVIVGLYYNFIQIKEAR